MGAAVCNILYFSNVSDRSVATRCNELVDKIRSKNRTDIEFEKETNIEVPKKNTEIKEP